MATNGRRLSGACLVVLSLSSMATAQDAGGAFPVAINTEQNPSRNLSGAALAARSPGKLVTAGLVRTQTAMSLARGIIEITEPLAGADPKATFLSKAIEILFEQLNNTLLVIGNALLERAGLPPLAPSDVSPPSTDTTDGSGANPAGGGDVVRNPK